MTTYSNIFLPLTLLVSALMRSLEKGQDKKQSIFQKIRQDTLEPAEQEAKKIIEDAHKRAEEIKIEAQKNGEQILKQARAQVEQERNVFHTALEQSARQTLEGLRQDIEHKFFHEELQAAIDHVMSNGKVIADLIDAIVKAIEKEGIHTDIAVVIPRLVSPDDVCDLLIENIRKKLKNHPIEIGRFSGGVQVKLVGKKLTLDITSSVIKELLASYIRKDFRKLIFT